MQSFFALAKKYDLNVWFHSCGQFRPVMGDLIVIGLDVWEYSNIPARCYRQNHLSMTQPQGPGFQYCVNGFDLGPLK